MYEQTFSSSCMKFLSLYKTFTLSIQGTCAYCTRVYKGTYVEGFEILLKSFPFWKDEGHSLTHIPWSRTHLIQFYYFYMFIGWPTTVMMNRNLYWVSFPHFPLGITSKHGSPPICTLLVVAMSKFCHCTRHLH